MFLVLTSYSVLLVTKFAHIYSIAEFLDDFQIAIGMYSN